MRELPRSEAASRQPVRRFALRAGVSALFIWLALRGISLREVFHAFRSTSPAWLVGGLCVLALSFAVGAQRWRLLVRHQGIRLSLAEALRYTWIGLFFANLLPGGFGGDAARAWVAGRRTNRLSRITASGIMDRLISAWALVALGAIAAVLEFSRLPRVTIVACLLAAVAVALGTVVLLHPEPGRRLSRAVARWPRASGPVGRISEALAGYRHTHGLLARALLLSFASQALVVIAAYLLARSLGMHVSVALLAVSIPVVLLATAAPTSLNGLGIREAVFRVLLVPAGVAPATAVAFSLMTVIAAAIVSLPGAFAWAALRREAPAGEVREPAVAAGG